MPSRKITSAIDLSVELATGTLPEDADVVGFPMARWMSQTSPSLPKWWSFARDMALREFWKKSSHLSTLMYTAQTLLVGVPLKIEARDPSIVSHVEQAEVIEDVLMNVSEFGESLFVAKRKFIEDYLGTDNGGFMEVIGAGEPDGPIEGLPLSVRHLDSVYCWRTGNKEYPVVYHDPLDGKAYKLHRTRVIYMSQMTSAMHEMAGVGFCSVSRSIQFAQHLYDIYIHKQEKLGSRPISTILVGAGFKGSHIMKAVTMAQVAMNNEGLTRYGRTIGLGSENTDASLQAVTLNSFDPFDEQTAITFAMYGLAASFGIPVQEVWPSSGGRSGREGSMQESRQRGKLPAEFHSELELQLEQKYLPPYLRAVHDYRDDYQDERRAVNQDIRARNRERDLGDGAITISTARQIMLDNGELTRDQFTKMELHDGRLENGELILSVFYSTDNVIAPLLNLGVLRPTDTKANDKNKMLLAISARQSDALAEIATTTNNRSLKKINKAYFALEHLKKMYLEEGMDIQEDGEDVIESPTGEEEQVDPQEQEDVESQEIQTREPSQSREARVELAAGSPSSAGPWG